MASLAARDAYIQKLASKVCAKPSKEPRERPYVPFRSRSDAGPPKKNRTKQKHPQGKNFSVNNKKTVQKTTVKPAQKPSAQKPSAQKPSAQKPSAQKPSAQKPSAQKPSAQKPSAQKPSAQKPSASPVQRQNAPKPTVANGTAAKSPKGEKAGAKFSTVDLLRKRLHDKIEASRGQGTPKDPSSEAVLAKRAKRKVERERKKRKRKAFRMKELAEKAGEELALEIKQEEAAAAAAAAVRVPAATARVAGKKDEEAIIFNKVETVEDGFVDKIQKKKEKKKHVKGNLTPLTGKNYKQLLGRVEARKAKLEHLRETDEGKAKVLEEKMKWTNVLYKAEGLKIKDNEDLLRKSLKKKEKMRSQRKKKWSERSQTVLEKMQHRQDKRQRNIKKRKDGKVEKKKDRARKKGRVLPEDLRKAKL